MRGVEFQQSAEAGLTVFRPRNLLNAIPPILLFVAMPVLAVVSNPHQWGGRIVILVGCGLIPFLLPKLTTALKPFQLTLTANDGTVRVDGEPLESARVESRVLMTFLTRQTKCYSLSLWVMFTDGESRTVELGRFRTMLEVSNAAGTIEGFLLGNAVKSSPASSSSVR